MFTVYKTTYLSSGQYYYGFHETNNPQDMYLGSGIWIKRAVKKYGRKSFRKDVLFVFRVETEAYNKEVELIKSAYDDPLCMNLQEGGKGSFRYINKNGLCDYTKAARAGGKKASESGQAAAAAAIGRQRMIESGVQAKNGRILGRKNVESGFLATLRTPEHQARAGSIAGRIVKERSLGIFALTYEQRVEISRAAGRKNVESGHMAALGKSGKGHHIRWHVKRGLVNEKCKLCIQGTVAVV